MADGAWHSPLRISRSEPSRGQRECARRCWAGTTCATSRCHLGGSSSIAAFRDGVAVDTSFGTSPQSGLPQNNRVGDMDAFAVLYMMKKLNVDADEMARILGCQSGLAGISGTSGDMRDLDEAAAAGNKRARLALDVFVRAIRHYLGAFLLELGGRGRDHVLRRRLARIVQRSAARCAGT